jgi:hypothetical protein
MIPILIFKFQVTNLINSVNAVVEYVRFQVLMAGSVKFRVFCVVTLKLTDVSEVHTTSIIRAMMETVCNSEMSANFNVTIRHYIPEGSNLHHYT